MTTIQDRIIEKFREQFDRFPDDYYNGIVGKDGSRFSNTLSGLEELEEFILTSIKLVQEETKGDVLNKLHAMVCDLATDKGKDLAKEDCLELIRYQIERIYGKKLLSITNKEKQK